MEIQTSAYSTPCGAMRIATYGGDLILCDWDNVQILRKIQRIEKAIGTQLTEGISPLATETMHQLDEYFAGQRRQFDLPIRFIGTDFQKRVWQSLLSIPYGETITYAEQSRRLGIPKAIRAIASANGANPISVIAPCHRVIGSNGKLTGYAGGLNVKQFLLDLEKPSLLTNYRITSSHITE